MQTNKPINVDDLPIIIRFYQSQNIKKAYRVTYRSKGGNENFVGAKDKNEADKKVKEIEDGGHKIINVELLKAKVYIKNPQDAPKGVKVERGKRGGLYYETNNKNRQQEKPHQQRIENIRVLTTDSPDFDKIEHYILVGVIHPINIEKPLNKDYIQKVINDNKIDISDVQVNILPFDATNTFAFTAPNNNNKIYLVSTPDKIIYDWLDELYSELTTVGYKLDEINDARNVDTKRAASIIHEIGHTKVYKVVGVMESMSELRQKQFKIFNNYVQYLKEFYFKDEQTIYSELEEMLAEDYRQLVGGIQSKMPSRYFYVDDLNRPQLKEGRLNILRKMGVF